MSNEKIAEKLIEIEKILLGMKNDSLKLEKTHLKTKDACEFLGVSQNTLLKICVEHEIYPVKLSGLNFYTVEDLKSLFLKKEN
jgi:hypothetical protein